LLKKNYPDGVIYEHVDFSRFNLPLQHVGVIYRDIDGKILEDLTPLVSQ
jgi:mannosyltransferase OCH1-like enzyme